jgi:glutaredoxin 2
MGSNLLPWQMRIVEDDMGKDDIVIFVTLRRIRLVNGSRWKGKAKPRNFKFLSAM